MVDRKKPSALDVCTLFAWRKASRHVFSEYVRDLASHRSIVNEDLVEMMSQTVNSPAVYAFAKAYEERQRGCFVVYAPANTGKTVAGVTLLRKLLSKMKGKTPNGLMICGERDANETYEQYLRRSLDAPHDCPDFLHRFLLAIGNNVSDEGSSHERWGFFKRFANQVNHSPDLVGHGDGSSSSPVVIIDDFNALDSDDKDLDFIRKLMFQAWNLKVVVFILTQRLYIANTLCRINGWEKILPLPLAHNTDTSKLPRDADADRYPDPEWNNLSWSIKQLKLLVQSEFPTLDDRQLSFLNEHMKPTDALVRANALTCAKIISESDDYIE